LTFWLFRHFGILHSSTLRSTSTTLVDMTLALLTSIDFPVGNSLALPASIDLPVGKSSALPAGIELPVGK
jgi:hypothetical protein